MAEGRAAKVQIELIKGGTEVLVSVNREGLRFLADICRGLAEEDYE